MTPLLAHQGGWDELLVVAGLVLAMLAVSRIRRRRGSIPAPARDVCGYCGAALAGDATRCPSCRFRHRPPEA